jgi:hypothetical protein
MMEVCNALCGAARLYVACFAVSFGHHCKDWVVWRDVKGPRGVRDDTGSLIAENVSDRGCEHCAPGRRGGCASKKTLMPLNHVSLGQYQERPV